MIKVYRVVANDDFRFGKNATFTKGKEYIARKIKSDGGMVARSNEGVWVQIADWRHTLWLKDIKRFTDKFTIVEEFYVRNYEELKSAK
jgi:hypothetical protein